MSWLKKKKYAGCSNLPHCNCSWLKRTWMWLKSYQEGFWKVQQKSICSIIGRAQIQILMMPHPSVARSLRQHNWPLIVRIPLFFFLICELKYVELHNKCSSQSVFSCHNYHAAWAVVSKRCSLTSCAFTESMLVLTWFKTIIGILARYKMNEMTRNKQSLG